MPPQQRKVNRVLVFGDFDLLHPGHLHFLREAKKHGKELFVVVTPTSCIKKFKKHDPLFGEKHRREVVEMMSFVKQAVFGDRKPKSFKILDKINPDVICVGYDQKDLVKHIRVYLKKAKKHIPIKRLPPYDPKKFKSGYLKKLIQGKVCLQCQI